MLPSSLASNFAGKVNEKEAEIEALTSHFLQLAGCK